MAHSLPKPRDVPVMNQTLSAMSVPMPAIALGIPALGNLRGSVAGVNRASLDKDPREVASMFDAVAQRYDLTNTVLSLGQDRFWRRATRSALRIGSDG